MNIAHGTHQGSTQKGHFQFFILCIKFEGVKPHLLTLWSFWYSPQALQTVPPSAVLLHNVVVCV